MNQVATLSFPSISLVGVYQPIMSTFPAPAIKKQSDNTETKLKLHLIHVILLKCSMSEHSSRPPSLHLAHLTLPSLKLPSSVSRLPLSALHHLLPFPSLHVSFPSPPAAPLCPPQPCSLAATRPHCLWRVIDFLPALEMRAARARLEVTHFPGAFSSLLINHSLGPPHSLLIQAAIRANSPFEKSVNRLAGGRAGSKDGFSLNALTLCCGSLSY